MENFNVANDTRRAEAGNVASIRPYETPSIRVMDERDVLSSLQVTVAAITWWGM